MTLKTIVILGIVLIFVIFVLMDAGLAMGASRNRRAYEDEEQAEYIRKYNEKHATRGTNDTRSR